MSTGGKITEAILNPWIPRFRVGDCSDEMIDGRGTEGKYVQFDWLGWSLSIQLHSVYAERRFIEQLRREGRLP